mmetsp:Transcript_14536/g.31132  ORF Transcript_14536/g.31132 Transcript_14536/m.31132 type:complete len:396 (-) Transcript_14536:291-1478(-)
MATALSEYERERLQRIAENQARMNALGLVKQTSILGGMFKARKPTSNFNNKEKVRQVKPVKSFERTRTSARLQGHKPQYAPVDDPDTDKPEGYVHEYNKYGDRIEVSLNPDVTPEEKDKAKFKQLMERRCTSQGRGSVYDSEVGICCHFCRQKKLCGEPDCPRCERRNKSAECVGKTECSRCHSATGKFCRACLLIRYGEEMQDARANPEWLCPHCYELEHPEEHWICNSSICMTRRKMRPTGIAIFDAQARGFPSVGHWLQAQLKQQRSADVPPSPATPAPSAAAAPAPATPAPVTPARRAGGEVSLCADDMDTPLAARRASKRQRASKENVEESNARSGSPGDVGNSARRVATRSASKGSVGGGAKKTCKVSDIPALAERPQRGVAEQRRRAK